MRRSGLGIIFGVVFIDLVGFGIVIPILPYYAREFGASAWALGWLMTSYSLTQFVFAPVWGRVSDRIGRRPVLLISILGTVLSMTFLGLARSLEWLFIGRLFAGICGANISTAYAYVADVTEPKDRAKGMGMIGAAFGLGFIFGPVIGGVLAHFWGYSVPMFAGAALAAVNWFFAWARLGEPNLPPEVRSSHRSKRFDLGAIRTVLSRPGTGLAIGLFFLLTFAVTQLEVTFALYMKERHGSDALRASELLGLMGVIMALVQGRFIGPLVRRFGESRLVVWGSALCAFALVAFAGAPALLPATLALSLLALGHGALHPSLSSLASQGAGLHDRGATMGVFQSAGSLARVVGPPVAGLLYDQIRITAPFHAGALVLLLCCLIAALRLSPRSGRAAA
jgi:DHA1 family tetracycline resistance protein-like MFS transporter